MTLRISWSQLRVHEECKERGHHQRSGRRATLDNQRVFFPGTVTDRVVRDWLSGDPLETRGAMPSMVEAILDREYQEIKDNGGVIAWKSADDRRTVLKDCVEAVTKIEPALLRYVVPYEYQVAMRFQVLVSLPHPLGHNETVLLVGEIDILVRDDKQRWWVWDVKHTRDNQYWRKTKGQLTFYDLCVELMFGAPTIRAGLLQPLCREQVKPFSLTEDDRAQMVQRISGMARDIWNDEHPPRQDSTLCGWCSVRHACSKFQPVVVGGKRRITLV